MSDNLLTKRGPAGPGGAGICQVKLEDGSLEFRIGPGQDGKVENAAFRPWQGAGLAQALERKPPDGQPNRAAGWTTWASYGSCIVHRRGKRTGGFAASGKP